MKILGMSWIEFVIILAIILIIFGPKQLPKLGRAIGKTVRNLKKGMGSDDEQPAEEASSTEVAIVAVEPVPTASASAASAASAAAASVTAEADSATSPAPAPAPTVKKTVVKKKVG